VNVFGVLDQSFAHWAIVFFADEENVSWRTRPSQGEEIVTTCLCAWSALYFSRQVPLWCYLTTLRLFCQAVPVDCALHA
jgi:hypothetical protein